MAKRISIKPPEITLDDPEYYSACKAAIQPSAVKLLQLAAEVGWEAKQAAAVLMFVAATSAAEHDNPNESKDGS